MLIQNGNQLNYDVKNVRKRKQKMGYIWVGCVSRHDAVTITTAR